MNLSILNILSYSMIETCFKLIKSSEHQKLWRYSSYKSPNILDCSEDFSWFPNLILLLNSKNRRPWKYLIFWVHFFIRQFILSILFIIFCERLSFWFRCIVRTTNYAHLLRQLKYLVDYIIKHKKSNWWYFV